MPDLGPVSAACARELRTRAKQRGIIIWLDREGAYTELVDALVDRHAAGDYDVPVVAFRGSYLETLLDLDGLADGVDPVPLVVHLPGLTEDDVRATPLLEIYRAGQRHRRALPTAVREAAHGRAAAADIEAFVARDDLSLAAADAWLDAYGNGDRRGPDLSALDACALFDAVMTGGTLAAQLEQPDVVDAVWHRAAQLLGVESHMTDASDGIASQLAAWAMRVEFVDDLRRPPLDAVLAPLADLAKPFRASCRDLAVHIRERHADFYAARALDQEAELSEEKAQATAADLGRVDTFQFEDEKVMTAALDALGGGRFAEALDFAVQRTDGRSFWPRRNRSRRLGWQLVDLSARLGLAIDAAEGLLVDCSSVAEAATRYAERGGHAVDRCQRKLEQAWQSAGIINLDEYPAVRQRVVGMRRRYRAWSDAQAVAFNTLCAAHGYLPGAAFRQRSLFDEVVEPWTGGDGVTAYFLVDALRYEMGEQLAAELRSDGDATVHIKPRLAELPTITEVGMNILAPVCDGGVLRPELDAKHKILGFRAGQVRVSTPEQRRKAIHVRTGGDTCPGKSLEEVVASDVASLRKSIARARLIVVHSEGIDKAGENGSGLQSFERELENLRAAHRRLYEAGVTRFVITADHGFLLHDPDTRIPIRHRNKVTPNHRYVSTPIAAVQQTEVGVSATDLGYETGDVHFVFPANAAPFDTGKKAKYFVHGGNSLQERVIPVITVEHRHQAGEQVDRYQIEAEIRPPVAHMHCVRARVRHELQTTLSYGGRATVEVTLECVDAAGVRLEIVDVRDADHRGNIVAARVDGWFEVFFRVTADNPGRVLVQLRHATGSDVLDALTLRERFDIEVRLQPTPRPAAPDGDAPAPAPPPPAPPPLIDVGLAWLAELPDDGVRAVFTHLANHGSINEAQATDMLGSPRKFRRFSRKLDEYAAVAPFRVRTDFASGTKCYVREGT